MTHLSETFGGHFLTSPMCQLTMTSKITPLLQSSWALHHTVWPSNTPEYLHELLRRKTKDHLSVSASWSSKIHCPYPWPCTRHKEGWELTKLLDVSCYMQWPCCDIYSTSYWKLPVCHSLTSSCAADPMCLVIFVSKLFFFTSNIYF